MKNPNEPSSVATPMSIPCICRTATTQAAAASPSVAVSTATVVPARVRDGADRGVTSAAVLPSSKASAGFRSTVDAELDR